jgi:hypothetical protein
MWHLLKPKHSISDTDSQVHCIWMPANTCNTSLDLVGIFKDHHGLCEDIFR